MLVVPRDHVLRRIRGFLNDMRYINPRFTYLLTYLLRRGHSQLHQALRTIQRVCETKLILRIDWL